MPPKVTSFDNRATELHVKNYLTKRGYKDNFVKEQIRRAKRISRNEALQEHTPDDTTEENQQSPVHYHS